MTTLTEVMNHLKTYPIESMQGKVIDADVLLGYLFLAHDHHIDQRDHETINCPDVDEPYVNSLELADFIETHAR